MKVVALAVPAFARATESPKPSRSGAIGEPRPLPLASHPLIDHMVRRHVGSKPAPKQPTSLQSTLDTVSSMPGAWPDATAALPPMSIPSAPPPRSTRGLDDLPAELVMEVVDHAHTDVVLGVDARSFSKCSPRVWDVMSLPLAVELMTQRAATLRAQKPRWQQFGEMFLVSTTGRSHRFNLDPDRRLGAFVELMGSAADGKGNAGSGILGICDPAQRSAALKELERTGRAFGFHVTFFPCPGQWAIERRPADTTGEIISKLAGHIRTVPDALTVVGSAPDAAGLGGSGMLALPLAEQGPLLRPLLVQLAPSRAAMRKVLPLLADAIARTDDPDLLGMACVKAADAADAGDPHCLRVVQALHAVAVKWSLPQRRELLTGLSNRWMFARLPPGMQTALSNAHLAAWEETAAVTGVLLDAHETSMLARSLGQAPRDAADRNHVAERVRAISLAPEYVRYNIGRST